MSKDIEPRSLDEQDFFSKGDVQTNSNDDGIEEINSRAEDSVSDYEFGFKTLPGKNIEGSSGASDGLRR